VWPRRSRAISSGGAIFVIGASARLWSAPPRLTVSHIVRIERLFRTTVRWFSPAVRTPAIACGLCLCLAGWLCKLRCVSSAGARDRGGAAPGEWLASGTSAMHYYAQDMRSQVRASPARIPAAVLAYSSPSSATLAGMERAPIFETLRSWRGLRAEDRFDDEPRDLIGKTVFVKDHGQGQVLDFSKARIGSSQ
jgi:hypothetical protein